MFLSLNSYNRGVRIHLFNGFPDRILIEDPFIQGGRRDPAVRRSHPQRYYHTPPGLHLTVRHTVRSILTNEKHKNDAPMQKFYTEDFLTKEQIPNRGILPQYYVKGNHEYLTK